MFGSVFDCEADGLKPTKIHVFSATYDGETISSTNDYDKIKTYLMSEPVVVGHNIARWDTVEVSRLVGCEIPKETLIVDTLALSWYLCPERPSEKHPDGSKKTYGLASFGIDYGIPKPKVDDWHNLSYEEYRHRCEEDVKINSRLWKDQYSYLLKLYGSHENVVRFLRYLAFKMDCAREQERSRWKLDVEKATLNKQKLEKLFDEKTEILRRCMPAIPITRVVKRPKSLYKRNGELSVSGERWVQLAQQYGFDHSARTEVEIITGYDEPNPGSVPQIKKWLLSLGWVPRTFKTNDKGVEVPQVNKQKQDGGGVCDSVKDLYEKDPNLEHLDGYFVLRHRIGILDGFLDAVSDDGYVVARIQGLTNTLRFKHAECVNLPKVDAPYGEEIRGCLIAPDGYELCGSDMSSLEDRTKQHFMFKYDPEYVREMMTEDFDPHIDIAIVGGLMSKVDGEFYKKFKPAIASKDEHTRYKLLKTIRGIAKNTNYACVYGAGGPKIAKTAGISLEEAISLHSAYWKRNWAVRAVASSLKVKTVLGQKWLFNPVSRFWYSLRNEKDRFSTLNQGTGVFAFDTWVGFVHKDRPQLTGQFHDEIILCVKKGYREEIKSWLKQTIKEVNDILNLDRELDIGVEFGDSYADIH